MASLLFLTSSCSYITAVTCLCGKMESVVQDYMKDVAHDGDHKIVVFVMWCKVREIFTESEAPLKISLHSNLHKVLKKSFFAHIYISTVSFHLFHSSFSL